MARKRYPLMPARHWGVFQDSSLEEKGVATKLARFVNLPKDRRTVTKSTIPEYRDSILRQSMQCVARQQELLAGLEGGLERVFDELGTLRDGAKEHEKDQLEKGERIEQLEEEARKLEEKCLAREQENIGLRAEVQQLKGGLEEKGTLIASLEKKLDEAHRSQKALAQDVGRLKDDYQLAQLKLSESRKHHKRAEAKAVSLYKKSQAFQDDVADLFGGEMQKLLSVFADELKLRAPDVDPRNFLILQSLFEPGEGTGEGPQAEGEGPQIGGQGGGQGEGPQGEGQGGGQGEGPQGGGQGGGQGDGPQGGGQGGAGAGPEGDHGKA